MKRKMVKLILTMLIFIGAQANAQTPDQKSSGRTPEQMAQFQTDKMKEHLGLTGDLLTSVQNINLKYAHKIASIRQSDSDMESKKEQMIELKGQKESDLKAVLTEEQLSQWRKARNEMAGKKHPPCDDKK